MSNYEQALLVRGAAPPWLKSAAEDALHGLAKRRDPRGHQMSPEEAGRLIRALHHYRQPHQGRLLPLARPNPVGQIGGGGLLVVPKRTSSPADLGPGSGIRRSDNGDDGSISVKLSGHQLIQENDTERRAEGEGSTTTTTTRPPDGEEANGEDSMSCNMRRFIYRATKTSRSGSQCTGLVMATICYGGCDTGEIADWVFPYKKSIHKVCQHGGRQRRRIRLSHCRTSSGEVPSPEELQDLAIYRYVDATSCVCKKCASADTACLGTMSRPQLQTMGEAVAEIGEHPALVASLYEDAAAGGDDGGD